MRKKRTPSSPRANGSKSIRPKKFSKSSRPTTHLVESPKAKKTAVLKAFSEVWESLFTTPVHLDSALSKQPVQVKSILAQMIPAILLRPASLAQALGIGVGEGEPWSYLGQNFKEDGGKKIAQWRPPFLLAERIYEGMVQSIPKVEPIEEDFPPHLLADWKEVWGDETRHSLMQTLGKEPPLGLRASRKWGAEKLLKELTLGSRLPVRAEVSQIAPFGVHLSGYASVLKTEAYQQGMFEIQDEGSQLMALFALWPEKYHHFLSSRPGQFVRASIEESWLPPEDASFKVVIDACAGAGGKSLAIADALKGKARVYAYDTSEKKLLALRRRAIRAGLNNIQTLALPKEEEEKALERFKGTADRVLVDAPCSGWGVLRRNPDTKWRQGKDVLERMPEIQFRLLSIYSKLVAPGGKLTFGVCTFRSAETREVVSRFSSAHPEFVPLFGGYLGPGPCDGFYMHSWVRK